MTGSGGAGSTDGGTVGTAVRGKTGKSNDLTGIVTRIYEGTRQNRRRPHAEVKGKKVGRWEGDVFIPEDDAVPPLKNDEKKSYGQIRKELKEQFRIDFRGIPFPKGDADFSVISIAEVNFADVVERRIKADSTLCGKDGINFGQILKGRKANASVADELVAAAENKPTIPGLGDEYTGKELGDWRRENHFTWHETIDWSYQLVPTIIHENIHHTGLVAMAGKSVEIGIARLTEKWKRMK